MQLRRFRAHGNSVIDSNAFPLKIERLGRDRRQTQGDGVGLESINNDIDEGKVGGQRKREDTNPVKGKGSKAGRDTPPSSSSVGVVTSPVNVISGDPSSGVGSRSNVHGSCCRPGRV